MVVMDTRTNDEQVGSCDDEVDEIAATLTENLSPNEQNVEEVTTATENTSQESLKTDKISVQVKYSNGGNGGREGLDSIAVPDFDSGDEDKVESDIESDFKVHQYASDLLNQASSSPEDEQADQTEISNLHRTSGKENTTPFSLQDIINTVLMPQLSDTRFTKIQGNLNTSAGANSSNVNETGKADKNKFMCIPRNLTENVTALVNIANRTELINTLNFKDVNITGDCALVMFYAPWCMFCARTAPSYNALARAFPQLMVLAVDAVHFNSLNARFGTVSVPNILLFHVSRAVVRYNETDRSFHNLVEFVHKYTGLKPNTSIDVSDEDIKGPLPSIPSDDPDKWLFICWLFILAFGGWVFANSETGQNLWKSMTSFGHEHIHIE